MSEPKGKVTATTTVARACGCKQEFQQFTADRFAAQRIAKLQKTRCQACAAAWNAEQQRIAAETPKKGEAIQSLPPGAAMTLTRNPDGTWAGALAAGGTKVEAKGEGPQGVVVTLARQWVLDRKPKQAAPKPV